MKKTYKFAIIICSFLILLNFCAIYKNFDSNPRNKKPEVVITPPKPKEETKAEEEPKKEYIPPKYYSEMEYLKDDIENLKKYKIYKTFNLYKDDDLNAVKTIEKFLAKDLNETEEEFQKFRTKFNYYSHAIKFDLNNDGIQEIIGYNSSYCGSAGCTLYIIQKKNNKWNAIGTIETPKGGVLVYILTSKTNGYYDIRTTHDEWKDNITHTIHKYKNYGYSTKINYGK